MSFPVRAITLDLDDTVWPIAPVMVRAERVLADWLREHAPRTAERWPLPKMRELRDAVAAEHPDLAHDFPRQRLIALPEWASAKTVLAFVSMRSEVQTQDAVDAARAAGKRVGTTRMLPDYSDLEVREWRVEDELEESGQMFLQPPAEAPVIPNDEIDLVIVPALAADDRGYRIGYGKGYYDRLLPKLTRAFRAAVIFDFEVVAEVPEQPYDTPVDVVITDIRELRRA